MSVSGGDQGATVDELVERVRAGNRRAAARLITRIERHDPSVVPVLKALYMLGGNTTIVGVTGPPGAGKSTLINGLIQACRRRGRKLAVLAVDPSSPYTGGAILGDRVRMNQHAGSPDVFIRSMAARGHLGGLSRSTADALTVLDAMNFDMVIVETVGVGQNEVEIVRHANTVLLVQPPHTGDRIQSFKSGIIEIADIFIVNKADLPGVDDFVGSIEEAIRLHHEGAAWVPPVVETRANSGDGIERVLTEIDNHRHFLREHPEQALATGTQRAKYRVSQICEQILREKVFDQGQWSVAFQRDIESICAHRLDPYSVAEALVMAKETSSGQQA